MGLSLQVNEKTVLSSVALHGMGVSSRPYFFLRFSRVRVDRLSYDGKMTDKREQCHWMAEKKLNGLATTQPAPPIQ